MKFSQLKKLTAMVMVTGLVVVGGTGLIVSADSSTSGGSAEFVPNNDPGTPIDPTDPGQENNGGGDQTGNGGELKIVVRPTLVFGEQKVSAADKTYYASSLKVNDNHHGGIWEPRYVQVTDDTGEFKGWHLTVAQLNQFTGVTSGKQLDGAKITFNNGRKSSMFTDTSTANFLGVTSQPTVLLQNIGATYKYTVMDAKAGSGNGSFVTRFGDQETQYIDGTTENHHNISLFVKGGTAGKEVYNTTLSWNLENTPK
ncbi:MAG: WxL domain-containing protein [Clostridioides sp.]|jgi:hypothetical protein|nr:WxL domain-containing protein [Clostridioides sp.]